MLVSSFERGKISLQDYLERTVFYRSRAFSQKEFLDYMHSLSKPCEPVLEFARQLRKSGKCLMGTINNESRELNLYRIDTYGLRDIFHIFVSSCFVGLRKPEEGIYRLALEVTQRPPEECCFVDDRPLNLDAAAQLGMRVVRMETPEQLQKELSALLEQA